jgi:hypothetical protein
MEIEEVELEASSSSSSSSVVVVVVVKVSHHIISYHIPAQDKIGGS